MGRLPHVSVSDALTPTTLKYVCVNYENQRVFYQCQLIIKVKIMIDIY